MAFSGSELTAQCREQIILGVIARARPRWPFGWFNICPVNDVQCLFHVDWWQRNDAYRLLETFHCVGYFGIPREIRKAIPALIREALSSKINVTCEIEEAQDSKRAEGTQAPGESLQLGRREGRIRP